MSSPTDLRYTQSHEWVRIDGDLATCGITAHAQEALGDVVYVEMPEVGDDVAQGAALGEIESVKAVSDIYAALSGEVVEINEAIDDAPEVVNSDPYGAGWLWKIKMSDTAQLDAMMDAAAYDSFVAAQEG